MRLRGAVLAELSPRTIAFRVAGVLALMLAVNALRIGIGQPGYGVSFLALMPIVVAAFWLGPVAAWVVAVTGLGLIVAGELATASESFLERQLGPVTVVRLATFGGIAALVNWLLARERVAARRAAEAAGRAHAEQAARVASEAAATRLRSLVGGLQAIVWETDARTGQFTFVSERAEELLGYPAARWLGDPGFWSRIVHPDDRERVCGLHRQRTAERADYDLTYRALTADGRVVWLHDVVHVVHDADGPRRLYGVLVDITGQKRREQSAELLAAAGRAAAGRGAVTDRLAAVAALAVGVLCDVALVRLRGADGRYGAVAAAPADAAEAVLRTSPIGMVEELRERFSAGRAFVVPERTDAMLRAACPDEASYREYAAVVGHGSSLIVPLVADGADVGMLSLLARGIRTYDDADVVLAEELGGRLALVVAAEAAAARQRALQRVTAALSAATGETEVARAVADELAGALGGAARVFALDPEQGGLRPVSVEHAPAAPRAALVPLDAAVPIADCARTGSPVWLPDRIAWERRYPGFGAEQAHRAKAALPLTAGGAVVGAVELGFPTDREFPAAERAFAETLAGQAAQALQRAVDADRRRGIAEVLQRSLLPPALPELDRVALAAHYQPAATGTDAGGDWYDVLPLPDGRVAVAVGDVVGHGPAAAAVMGQLRSALAAHLLDGHGPGAALGRLSRFARRVPGAAASTVVCLVLDPPAGRVEWAHAGHPPPLVLAPAGARYLDGVAGRVLGLSAEQPYEVGTADLAPGSTILLYTDGLVERRGEDIDEGLDRLAAAAAAHAAHDPARLLPAVLDRALDGIGSHDDVAVVVARLLPAPLLLRLPARPDRLRPLRAAIDAWAVAQGLRPERIADLQLVVGEAAANAVEHAYGGRAPGTVTYHLRRTPAAVHVEVTDTGRWRPPSADPGHRGRGLTVVRALGTDVDIDTDDRGTRVRATLTLDADGSAPGPSGVPPGGAARLRLNTGPPGPRLCLSGDLDMAATDRIRGELRARLATVPLPEYLDLRELRYLGSAGVGVVVEALERAPGLRVIASGAAARVLTLAGFADVLETPPEVTPDRSTSSHPVPPRQHQVP